MSKEQQGTAKSKEIYRKIKEVKNKKTSSSYSASNLWFDLTLRLKNYGVLVLAGLVLFVLSGCPLPVGWGYSNRKADTRIAGEDLRNFIPAPETGERPQFYFGTTGYSGTVVWKDRTIPWTGAFEAGTVYTAEVTLRAAAGYTFAGVAEARLPGSFTHSRSADLNYKLGSDAELTVTIRFPVTGAEVGGEYVVVDYDLQHYVPIPITGARPVTNLIREDLYAEIVWKIEGAEAPLGGDFTAFTDGVTYQAEITLKAANSYRFSPRIPFTYPAAAVKAGPDESILYEMERVLSVTYNAAKAAQGVDSKNWEIYPYIPVPGARETAVRSFAALGYMGTVVWKAAPDFVEEMPGNLFQPGTVYRASVTLYAAPGYTLKGAGFTYTSDMGGDINDSSYWENNGDSLTGMEIAFEQTDNAPGIIWAVTEGTDLTYRVYAPQKDANPVTWLVEVQYIGGVAWYSGESRAPHSGVFQSNAYEAEVTLMPVSGHTFFDNGKVVEFKHDFGNIVSIKNSSSSGIETITIIITFPKTGDLSVITK
jgi:hypothetical protein